MGQIGPIGLPGPSGMKGGFGDKGEPGMCPATCDTSPTEDPFIGVKGNGGGGDGAAAGERIKGARGEKGELGPSGPQGRVGPQGPEGKQGIQGDAGQAGQSGRDGKQGNPGNPGNYGLPGMKGASGRSGIDGSKGQKGEGGRDGKPGGTGSCGGDCGFQEFPCTCDTHIIARHSQTDRVPSCPPNWVELYSGYSLVYFESQGYGLNQDLGGVGSCMEEFQVMPFLQCGSRNVCQHGSRTDKSFWLTTNGQDDIKAMAPLKTEEDILPYISRCAVCSGTQYSMARHSYSNEIPECPANWERLWAGYSYLMVTGGGGVGGGQDLGSVGSCMENFFLPSFIECVGRGMCSYYVNNLDYWLAAKKDPIPGMFGMGRIYNGLDEIQNEGLSRCAVCAKKLPSRKKRFL